MRCSGRGAECVGARGNGSSGGGTPERGREGKEERVGREGAAGRGQQEARAGMIDEDGSLLVSDPLCNTQESPLSTRFWVLDPGFPCLKKGLDLPSLASIPRIQDPRSGRQRKVWWKLTIFGKSRKSRIQDPERVVKVPVLPTVFAG